MQAAAQEADGKRRRLDPANMVPIGQHDVASGPVQADLGADADARLPLPDRGDRRHAFWERQIHALLGLLGTQGLMTADELRRCIEALEPEVYRTASYYEKWAVSITTNLLERGVITNAELDAELGPAEEPEPPQPYAEGAIVRVRSESHATRWRRPHLRTPGYIHGAVGIVQRHIGSWPCPEKRAFGGGTRGKQPLYSVDFEWRAVADHPHTAPAGTSDAVGVEIYHSWLEPATKADLEAQQRETEKRIGQGHTHHHGHGRDCGDHVHDPRHQVEQKAVDAEIPCPPIARALVQVLLRKGTVSGEALRAAIEKVDMHDQRRGEAGRRVVARAWVDEAFKGRLLKDANAACAELGIGASNATAPTQLVVMECTPQRHHLITCTLCSCYPIALLGLSPDWYKSRDYRSRSVRDPRGVLRDFGTVLPPEQSVTVHDSTADCRYLVLPQRPAGTEGWSEERLQGLVTRDSMIGVTVLPPQ
eukprot:TRINITY_DN21850_c0_g2_i1.p1 TRINITY_DN21850_c0_g2~~TRINITY_DN21850_c0_g2_i1.p1  ORF type:complete len:501 (+),score=166.53 TRINITY_DN21850_c0_g2_i1:74-1504(+)